MKLTCQKQLFYAVYCSDTLNKIVKHKQILMIIPKRTSNLQERQNSFGTQIAQYRHTTMLIIHHILRSKNIIGAAKTVT